MLQDWLEAPVLFGCILRQAFASSAVFCSVWKGSLGCKSNFNLFLRFCVLCSVFSNCVVCCVEQRLGFYLVRGKIVRRSSFLKGVKKMHCCLSKMVLSLQKAAECKGQINIKPLGGRLGRRRRWILARQAGRRAICKEQQESGGGE